MFLRRTSTRAKNIKLIAKTIAGIFLGISLAQASENSLDAMDTQTITAIISLPQTGQTPTSPIPAIPGMDGYTYFGVSWAYNPTGPLNPPIRFTVGTGDQSDCITDNLTGLMWAKTPSDTEYTWDDALKSTASGGAIPGALCGYTDWHLPNINELLSLTNNGYAGEHGQAAWLQSQGFSNVHGDYYWSSSTWIAASSARAVGMFGGDIANASKTIDHLYVLPVRNGLGTAPAQIPQTGQTSTSPINPAPAGSDGDLKKGVAWPTPRFTAGSGAQSDCITDNLTGLVWAKNADLFIGIKPAWKRALKYVADMNTTPNATGYNLCGHKDWRLPNKNEFKSLINWGSVDVMSWLQSQGFINIEEFYWTSSATLPYNKVNMVWVINMMDGTMNPGGEGGPSSGLPIWPVRGGQ